MNQIDTTSVRPHSTAERCAPRQLKAITAPRAVPKKMLSWQGSWATKPSLKTENPSTQPDQQDHGAGAGRSPRFDAHAITKTTIATTSAAHSTAFGPTSCMAVDQPLMTCSAVEI